MDHFLDFALDNFRKEGQSSGRLEMFHLMSEGGGERNKFAICSCVKDSKVLLFFSNTSKELNWRQWKLNNPSLLSEEVFFRSLLKSSIQRRQLEKENEKSLEVTKNLEVRLIHFMRHGKGLHNHALVEFWRNINQEGAFSLDDFPNEKSAENEYDTVDDDIETRLVKNVASNEADNKDEEPPSDAVNYDDGNKGVKEALHNWTLCKMLRLLWQDPKALQELKLMYHGDHDLPSWEDLTLGDFGRLSFQDSSAETKNLFYNAWKETSQMKSQLGLNIIKLLEQINREENKRSEDYDENKLIKAAWDPSKKESKLRQLLRISLGKHVFCNLFCPLIQGRSLRDASLTSEGIDKVFDRSKWTDNLKRFWQEEIVRDGEIHVSPLERTWQTLAAANSLDVKLELKSHFDQEGMTSKLCLLSGPMAKRFNFNVESPCDSECYAKINWYHLEMPPIQSETCSKNDWILNHPKWQEVQKLNGPERAKKAWADIWDVPKSKNIAIFGHSAQGGDFLGGGHRYVLPNAFPLRFLAVKSDGTQQVFFAPCDTEGWNEVMETEKGRQFVRNAAELVSAPVLDQSIGHIECAQYQNNESKNSGAKPSKAWEKDNLVEYYSVTHKEWLPAIVTNVDDEGHIMINLKPDFWLALGVQAEKIRSRQTSLVSPTEYLDC